MKNILFALQLTESLDEQKQRFYSLTELKLSTTISSRKFLTADELFPADLSGVDDSRCIIEVKYLSLLDLSVCEM